MEILTSAHTWYFESIEFNNSGVLTVELIEGIKGTKKELVEIDQHNTLGPYYPVTVTKSGKIVTIQFPGALTFDVLNESFDIDDKKLEKEGKFLFKCSTSNYLEYISSSTSIAELEENFNHYLLWTEGFIINVISNEEPIVSQLSKVPNLSAERTKTYAAT